MTLFHFLAASILLEAWSSAVAIDEPRYAVFRTYDAYLVAGTIVCAIAEKADNQSFRALARYFR